MADDDGAEAGTRQVTDLRRSSRDRDEVRRRLEAWLATRLPAGAAPRIDALEGTSANGMSSETLLVDARWREDGAERSERLVARLAPGAEDVPVFPSYDLGRQFDAIRLVGELTDVPVPPVWWSEPDAAAIGAPFFVMSRVDGRVPPDVMPYNFGDSWLHDASPADQRHLQDATVDVIARLHAIGDAPERFAFLAPDTAGDTPLRRRFALTRDWYAFAAADGFRSPLVERALSWLEDRWPAGDAETVLCWGDSRIGNVMYDGFDPVAVLDWEMATLGPRELDVAWLVYGHRMFEDIATSMDLPGMPHFLRAEDVAATYESLTGHTPRDLAWYGTYAAVQYAIVFLRTGARSVHFGEVEMPAGVDDLVMNREPLERMLAGTYWS
ncbi:MAG TPA: phosphotransferase family protein [Acidimicrobiales bacterium]|nr:phosphotransferase family protein [Acidimicrobiales bacterium]